MNYKKIILTFIIFISVTLGSFASEVDQYINSNDISTKSNIGIYLINSKDGNVLYKRNEKKLLNPASTLKALTFGASYLTLKKDYKFETNLYKDKNNNLYLKLAGDTLFSEKDLNTLIKNAKIKIENEKIPNIFIDDTIIDKIPYPKTWMQEDSWPVSAPLSPYIINNNKVEISIKRSSLGTYAEIIQNDSYKFSIINELKTADKHDYTIERQYDSNSPIINFKGAISKDETIYLPVLNPEINFKIKFKNALQKNNIVYTKPIYNKAIPKDAILVASASHSIEEISKSILHNSNNYDAEIIFKVAGGKYKKISNGSFEDGLEMLQHVFSNEIEKEKYEISIVDASGVSRKNLVSVEFVVNCLKKLFSEDESLKNLFATPSVGTLSERLLFLNTKLKAKTGTLKDVSSIAGELITKKDNELIFAIIIQNSPKRNALLKNFEDNIISIFYKKY